MFGRALRIKLWERIKQLIDPKYVFPRKLDASLEDELAELKKEIDGLKPFD